MTDRELFQMALDALEDIGGEWGFTSQRTLPKRMNAIEALCARLAQPEQTVSMDEHKRLQELVTSQGIRLMEHESKQEPVAWWHDMGDVVDLNVSGRGVPLYTAPPQREWQGLTDEEIEKLVYDIRSQTTGVVATAYVARAIEAKLRQKNT